ncbi:hypothetical protein AJ78_07520 [Emergomyces pasteurianus Ep9510]|uniref:Uncharacterized protein n=1 Tax=Emergomyces pasteurianus Ep9510 TaxID=1447872 RepID=A0A1J9Q6C4_9EURO|nr:hypothetical protein AJ78_07520 [Emergomyces pasteurianus Ep9510]
MSATQDYHGTLIKLLTARGNQIFDIHFLPEGFGDLLHEGTEIGISKNALVQCFVKARQIFFSLTPQQPQPKLSEPSSNQRRSVPEVPHVAAAQPTCHATTRHHPTSSPEDYSSQTLLLQTEILLLLDSEHLTACNWRKRRLCALKERRSQCPSSATQYHCALHTEISFTTTILRSPLHRHTKSPVLWHHRKWTMTKLFALYHDDPVAAFAGSHHLSHHDTEAEAEVDTDADADADTVTCAATTAAVNQIMIYEVSVVLQAGTHHPNNYYAFSYLREFMGLFADALAVMRRHQAKPITVGRWQRAVMRLGNLAGMVLEMVHTWCLAYSHRRDISAWSFLLWLLEVVWDADRDGDNEDVNGLRKKVVDKTARFGMEVSWDGEGLWIFVDLAMRKFRIDVDWLTRESPGGDLDLDDDQSESTAQYLSSVGDVGVDDRDGFGTASCPVTASSTSTPAHSNQSWKLWIRRMKAAQERNNTPVVITDNG